MNIFDFEILDDRRQRQDATSKSISQIIDNIGKLSITALLKPYIRWRFASFSLKTDR